MKALSVRQPWAWLLVHGWKDVENRTWATSYRGPLLIHAGKSFDREGYDYVRAYHPEVPLPAVGSYFRGGVVGHATLTGCVSRHPSPWFVGPYGWVLANPSALPFRTATGRLGLFDLELPVGWTS